MQLPWPVGFLFGMRRLRISFLPLIALLPWFLPAAASAQSRKTNSATRPPQSETAGPAEADPARLNAEVIRTTTAYKESLENLLGIYEREAHRLAEQVEKRRALYERGYVSRREFEESERALAGAEANVEKTRLQIAEVRVVITEASAREEILKLPQLPDGGYSETGRLIRFQGGAEWSLADSKKIERFFTEKFGRLLPVSALGQTEIHNRMKFDHRNAMDVAIHPDSPEGLALMAYLRKSGIPFTAFRDKASGSATGAHIHIGRPSLRALTP